MTEFELIGVLRNAPLPAKIGLFSIFGALANILIVWGLFPLIAGEWLGRHPYGLICDRRRIRLIAVAVIGLGLSLNFLTFSALFHA